MNKKLFYTQPSVDILEVRIEESLLVISGGGNIDNASEEDFGEL